MHRRFCAWRRRRHFSALALPLRRHSSALVQSLRLHFSALVQPLLQHLCNHCVSTCAHSLWSLRTAMCSALRAADAATEKDMGPAAARQAFRKVSSSAGNCAARPLCAAAHKARRDRSTTSLASIATRTRRVRYGETRRGRYGQPGSAFATAFMWQM